MATGWQKVGGVLALPEFLGRHDDEPVGRQLLSEVRRIHGNECVNRQVPRRCGW